MIRKILVLSFTLGVVVAGTSLSNAQQGLTAQSPPQIAQRVTPKKQALIEDLLEIIQVRKNAEVFIEVSVAQYEKDLPPLLPPFGLPGINMNTQEREAALNANKALGHIMGTKYRQL